MQELSLKKKMNVIKLYLEGFSYDEIAARGNISKGTVANVISELKAGRFPEYSDLSEQLELLRELAVDLRKSKITAVQAVLGASMFSRLQELGIEPSEMGSLSDLCRSLDKEGMEQIRQKLGVPPEGKVVGMLARLTPKKDHVTFLRAAAIINQIMPDTRFALVGGGPLRSYLENLSQEFGIATKTVFFGEQQDISTYLSTFDVAVLTSPAEGCCNSLLEAMAVGKPVVANDVGGNRELVHHGETGLLVPFGNVEAVVDAVLSLIRNPEVAKAMGRRARENIVSQFSLEKMVQQYQSIYDETLRQKRRRRELWPGRRANEHRLQR